MFWGLSIFRGQSTREPASGRVTYFFSAGLHRNRPHLTKEKLGRGFGKNAGEWTGRVEISKEELPGSKRSIYGYILTYSWLERENV